MPMHRRIRILLRLLLHEHEREAIVSFRADRLNLGRTHPSLASDQPVESPNGSHGLILRLRIENGAFPDHIVRDDESAWPGELQRPEKIVWIAHLVGVDEDEIEALKAIGMKAW